MNKELTKFVAHAREKEMDHATIRMLLLSAGWKEHDIAEALTAESLTMPVPIPPDRGGAREAFFYLLSFVSLYTTAISAVVLFFTYVNRLFPDAALEPYANANYDLSTIRWSMAALIVAYPIFILLARMLHREMQVQPDKAFSVVRRWLTYLTLLLAAIALAGDTVTLIFRLLEGELSVRFLLKVAVVLVVAGMSFSYYFLSLRSSPAKES